MKAKEIKNSKNPKKDINEDDLPIKDMEECEEFDPSKKKLSQDDIEEIDDDDDDDDD